MKSSICEENHKRNSINSIDNFRFSHLSQYRRFAVKRKLIRRYKWVLYSNNATASEIFKEHFQLNQNVNLNQINKKDQHRGCWYTWVDAH